MALVGPGSAQPVAENVKPLLDGVTEYEYVTILNPLSDDFAVRVAQDIPVNAPFPIGKDDSGRTAQTTFTERDAAQTYGLGLRNPDFQGKRHVINDTIIKAGHTINLKGNEAQVAVRQLVNEIMQREGNTRKLSDPVERNLVEQRVIRARGSIQELMDSNLRSTRDQLDEAINKSNEVNDAQPFPGLNQPAAGEDAAAGKDTGTDSVQPERRGPGRPKRTE